MQRPFTCQQCGHEGQSAASGPLPVVCGPVCRRRRLTAQERVARRLREARDAEPAAPGVRVLSDVVFTP